MNFTLKSLEFFHYYQIKYDLACISCRLLRSSEVTIYKSTLVLSYNRDQLVGIVEDFQNVECENCGKIGNWNCLNIWLNDKNDVRKQLILNIHKEDGQINGGPEHENYSIKEIELAFTQIENKFNILPNSAFAEKENGGLYIQVDFLNGEKLAQCRVFDNNGLSIDEVESFLIFVYNNMITKC